MPVNIEIKARCPDPGAAAIILAGLGAEHRGTDHQIDTYFTVKEGRLNEVEAFARKSLAKLY